MPRTPQRTQSQDLIVSPGDAITGADQTAGGDLILEGGDSTGGNNDGGNVLIRSGLPDGSGSPGLVTVTNNMATEDSPVLAIGSGSGNNHTFHFLTGTVDPNTDVVPAVAAGDLYVQSDGTLWQASAAGTGNWTQVGAGVTDLQTAYDGGGTIVTNSTVGALDVSGTEDISLSATGADVTIETASTTVPGNVIITGGGATAGPGGEITLTGGDVTAGAGGVGGAITATAGDSFGAFDGGPVDITAGQGGATNNGGDALIQGGAGGATSGNGGRTDLFGGDATTDGQGGIAAMRGGAAAGNNNGGNAGVTGGAGAGTGNGGAVVLFGGTAGATGDGGAVQLQGAAGGSTSGAGGVVLINAGNGNGASQAGGSISLNGGNSTNAVTGGAIVIKSGDSVTGSGGAASLQGGDATNATTGDGGAVLVQGGQGPEGGGNATLTGGASDDTGNGGTAFVLGGNVTSGAGNGGDVEITGGDGLGSLGLGGSITLTVGDTTGTNSAGQDITLTAGDGNGTADGGNIVLNPGSATGTGTDGEVTINGKLTVTGLIDPTGLVLDEQSSVPFSTTAGMGTLWVRDDAPNTLQFTDDGGTTHDLVNEVRDIWYGWVNQQDQAETYLFRDGSANSAGSRNQSTGFVIPADLTSVHIAIRNVNTGTFVDDIDVKVYVNNSQAATDTYSVNTNSLATYSTTLTPTASAGQKLDFSFEPAGNGADVWFVTLTFTYDFSTLL